ncbi:SLC13 family permease [Thalassotalea aquiviva]|uniref:SLC13 family permease n=1 Tax=Thalassotalea aquiviva TaxID=3242415 RepID=UPI00352A0059
MSLSKESEFDPLDMRHYRIEKLPTRDKSGFEKLLEKVGLPLAFTAFILIVFIIDVPYLTNIDPSLLGNKALSQLNTLGAAEFSRINIAMLAIFVAAIILWITEAIPNYLTSLLVIISIVLTGVTSERDAYAQMGHPVMWLNILSFILASMLVKTAVAKRFALWFVVRFGHNAASVFFSFMFINIILSMFISATTAKATILLPIFMVVAAVFGATGGDNKNNFGRNLVLQNLFQINIGAGMFITGSGANLLAGALIAGAIAEMNDFSFYTWMEAAFLLAFINMFIGWFVGTKLIFKIPKKESIPQIQGGLHRLKQELDGMGPIKFEEIKAIIIFVLVLTGWVLDTYHGISKTAVAFMGAVAALMPGIGIVKWNDVDIPWHLLLFSAGAYTLGAGFKSTDLPAITVDALFNFLGFSQTTPFWALYLILTGGMIFSALVFQSKTMRTLVFVPISIGVAQKFGYPILSLALPVALLIEHVYALPFNSKPAALLYVTNHYSWSDTFKFGLSMLVIGWLMIILWGETWLRYLGYTPNGVFGIF